MQAERYLSMRGVPATSDPYNSLDEPADVPAMVPLFLYTQLRLGWEELNGFPEHKTWRALFVVVLAGYIPVVGIAGLALTISKIANWIN